jgi:hypothetical protein
LCQATASGVIRISGSKRVYVLKRARRQLAADARLKLTLRMSKRARKAIRSAFSHHRRVKATLTVLGRDAVGNGSTAKRRALARR